jgi:hypothetical protein
VETNNNWPNWTAGIVPTYRLPKKVEFRDSYTARVIIGGSVKGYEDFLQWISVLNDPAQMARELRTAVLLSIVVNVRTRFVNNMERALEMHSVKRDEEGKASFSVRKRMRDTKLKLALKDAFEEQTAASIAGDSQAEEAARERIRSINDRLWESHGTGPNGEKRDPHPLSEAQGNVFRAQMYVMLSLITAPDMVNADVVDGRAHVGIGAINMIDNLLETPSATRSLSSKGTFSLMKSFWRHLEFGTGIHRSAAKDAKRNKGVKLPDTWYYGTPSIATIELAGTYPMNFLTDSQGEMFQEDFDALSDAIYVVLKRLIYGTA